MQRSYFDHNATTPVSDGVREALIPALLEVYGNASSIHHHGQLAKQRLETGRRQTAALIGCDPKDLVLLSGGTEANNLAIFGAVAAAGERPKHLITSVLEHPAVLNPCARLEQDGVDVTYVPVGSEGVVDPDDVRRALRPETVLISVMHANNEIGTVQPIAEIAAIAHEAGVPMHVDGVQAVGKIPVDVRALGVDFYTLSGHKFHAPKGVGALYVRKNAKLQPLQYGGRHEKGLRAGTENVPGVVAMGQAAAEAALAVRCDAVGKLRDRLERGLLDAIPDCGVNGDRERRLPNTTNLYFDGFEGEAMVISLDLKGFAVSSGSACSSGAVEASHVLLAIGLSKERAKSSIRFSLGPGNTAKQVDALIRAVAESAAQLRRMSPTYEFA